MVVVRKFMRYPGGIAKAVTFSYDDNHKYNIRLAKTLNKYGIKCTFNINSGSIYNSTCDNENLLSYEDIKENMLAFGHEIAVHGKNHRAPGILSVMEGVTEFIDCRKELEENLGLIIRGMAYPDAGIRRIYTNTSYEKIRSYLSDMGIVYSRTLGGDNNSFDLPSDWFSWMPTAHHTNPELMEYIDKFNEINFDNIYRNARFPRLFYLWGHSYEFNNDNNWDYLENICKELSGREDVWYATNIEIYDYITAYESLIWSADEKTVYNPTAKEIWFEINGEKNYSVKPNQTLKLD